MQPEITPSLVSVGIVNWNCGKHLPRCLKSLFSQSHPRIEVILIDNASTDGSRARVESEFPQVRVVRNQANRGYAAAQNQAADLARGEFYMALNPDVVLEPDYVAQALEGLAGHPGAGHATGKVRIMDPDGAKSSKIYSTGHLFPRNRRGYNRGIDSRDDGRYDEAEYIPGANGSCVLYRRDMMRDLAIGGKFWDEMFFMYGDDLDIDWRAAMRGWKCLYWPRAVAYHVGAGTGALARPETYGMFIANRYLMILKNDSIVDLARDAPWFLWSAFREKIHLLSRRPRAFAYAVGIFLRKAPEALRRRGAVQERKICSVRPWFRLSLDLIRRSRP